MKNSMFFLILIILIILSGCAMLWSPHKEFRDIHSGSYVSFFSDGQNRFAVYLPGIPSHNRSVRFECDCASGPIEFDDRLRWPNSLYEIWWDTIKVQTPCLCKLFYLRYYPVLDKDVQEQVKFPWGISAMKPMEDD